jgi:hypothetical protein
MTTWVKSSRSFANGNCVEVAGLAGEIGVRDSRNPGGTVLRFSIPQWRDFLDGARGGEYGPAGAGA